MSSIFTTYMGQEVILLFFNIGMLYRILPTLEGNNKGRKTKTKQMHCQYHLSSIIKLLCSWQTFYTTRTLKKLLHSRSHKFPVGLNFAKRTFHVSSANKQSRGLTFSIETIYIFHKNFYRRL